MDLQDIMAEIDLSADIPSWFTGQLDRQKIDEALEASGYTLPLANKVSFYMYKLNTEMVVKAAFRITWFPNAGKYGVVKLDLK